MRIAILSSEAVPFAKVGGLADVSGALTKALHAEAVDSFLILPFYDQIDQSLVSGVVFEDLEFQWRGKQPRIRVLKSDTLKAPTYLIDAPYYFSRGKIYGDNDDFERFAFFCRAAVALMNRLGEAPDIVHLNDWPCGFAAIELRARRRHEEFFRQTKTLCSIHNMAYQGLFDPADLWWLDFGPYTADFMLKDAASALKAGMIASDALSTVSPRYAQEIQTPEQGYGLDWLTRARRDRLVGITNGVDYEVWNPETDPNIAANYSAEDLTGKRECKIDLLRRFGLPAEPERPIIAIISRLVAQKGYDLIREAARGILDTGAFFIALGAGAPEYEDFLQSWHDRAPHRVGVYKGFAGEPLAHQIEAGADIFLMPSQFEPCGLNQMYSMRYGTVPVVHAVGGLADTVRDYAPRRPKATGFVFDEYTPTALMTALTRALELFADQPKWRALQAAGMRQDFSWDRSAVEYVKIYERVLAARTPRIDAAERRVGRQ